MVDLAGLLDLDSADGRDFFANIQGNVLKGHGRDHTAHVFMTFGADAAQARRWLAHFAVTEVTSGLRQWQETEGWKAAARAGAGSPFATFYLSASGYAALGLASGTPNDPYFRLGMKSPNTAGRTFNDPPVAQWEEPFRRDLHAMALLADDSRTRLDARVKGLCAAVEPFCAAAPFVQRGDKLTVDFGDGRDAVEIEHFGHQDGISNPQTIVREAQREIERRGKAHYDPSAPLELILVAEPGGAGHGSYLVFRKLEQNVRRFHERRAALAQAIGIDEELASALAVGRFRNGKPLLETTGDLATGMNDFSFRDQDRNGAVCPFQAHIRKSNPRGDIVTFLGQTPEFERTKRIGRRGITYGTREDLAPGSTQAAPEAGVGLLFMSHQAELDQFAIQQEGSDGEDFVIEKVGIDAVSGQHPEPQSQNWPAPGGGTKPFPMNDFVTMLGGEYFFAPSMTFLRALAPAA